MSETEPAVEPAPPVVDDSTVPQVAPVVAVAEPAWETVATNGRDATQRLAVPGGYLYRTTWEHRGPLGFGGSVHAVATFVPEAELWLAKPSALS